MSGLTMAKYIIEAALFSAGRPITLDELCEATELQRHDVKRAVKELIQEYKARESALTVTETGGTFALEVRAPYARFTMKLADQEIAKPTLKTLAIIAYHQPIQQSRLKLMVGHRVYEDVAVLREMGLITSRPEGRSFTLRTTSRFPEYFGVDPDPAKIKEHLAKLVGVDLSRIEAIEKAPDEGSTQDAAVPGDEDGERPHDARAGAEDAAEGDGGGPSPDGDQEGGDGSEADDHGRRKGRSSNEGPIRAIRASIHEEEV